MRFKLLFIIGLAFAACKEETILEAVPPEIGKISVRLFGDSIYFAAEIISYGSLRINSYGFVVSEATPPTLRNQFRHYRITDSITYNVFSRTIWNRFDSNLEYFVSGYLLTKDDTVYTDVFKFDGKERNNPIVDQVEPTHGRDGDLVQIKGQFFDLDPTWMKVRFGESIAEILTVTPNQISILVPPYLEAVEVPLTVERSGKFSNSIPFKLDGPKITALTDATGMGTFIFKVNGSGFSEVPWRNVLTVFSNYNKQYSTEVLAASPTELTVKLNATQMLPGNYVAGVIVNEKLAISPDSVRILTPWLKLSNSPSGANYSTSFVIGDKFYACTGTPFSSNGKKVMEYDIQLNTWTLRNNFAGQARASAFAFAVNGSGFIGGGSTSNGRLDDLWEYNPGTDSWVQRASIPNGARTNATAFSHNGKGYVIFGFINSSTITKDFWSYDPVTDSWEKLPDFGGNPRGRAAYAIKNNKLYIIAGINSHSSLPVNDSWSFDFSTKQWALVGPANFQPEASGFDSEKCYLLLNGFNYFFEFEMNFAEFDPETNKIVNVRPLFPGYYRGNSQSFIYNNHFYIGLGTSPDGFILFRDMWKLPIN